MRGFLPSLHTDPRMPTPSPAWVVPSGALSLCPQPPAALVTRAGTQRDHRIPGWGTDQDTAQPTEPSLQQLEGKLPFEFLLDAIQLLIRGKWQNKHSFSLLIWKSICLHQNYWQINSTMTFHFGSEAPTVDMTELFIQISTQYLN